MAAVLHFPSSKRAVRFRRFLLATSAYALCLPLLAIAHALDLVPARIIAEIAMLAIGVNLALYWVFASGANERFEDPSLTGLQIAAATLVVMYAAYHFDSQRSLPLMILLVVLAFGAFRFNTREFLLAAGVLLAGYAAVINLLMWNKPAAVNVWLEAFQWFTLAFVLPCFAL